MSRLILLYSNNVEIAVSATLHSRTVPACTTGLRHAIFPFPWMRLPLLFIFYKSNRHAISSISSHYSSSAIRLFVLRLISNGSHSVTPIASKYSRRPNLAHETHRSSLNRCKILPHRRLLFSKDSFNQYNEFVSDAQDLIGKTRKNSGTEPVITIERHLKKRVVLLFLSSLKAFKIQIQYNADFHAVKIQLYLMIRPIHSELCQPRTEQCDLADLCAAPVVPPAALKFTFTIHLSIHSTSNMLQHIHTE